MGFSVLSVGSPSAENDGFSLSENASDWQLGRETNIKIQRKQELLTGRSLNPHIEVLVSFYTCTDWQIGRQDGNEGRQKADICTWHARGCVGAVVRACVHPTQQSCVVAFLTYFSWSPRMACSTLFSSLLNSAPIPSGIVSPPDCQSVLPLPKKWQQCFDAWDLYERWQTDIFINVVPGCCSCKDVVMRDAMDAIGGGS